MKQLILMRHAKAAKDAENNSDFDRPLIERGKQEAAQMAQLLKKNKFIPELIICSPAKRTLKTAQVVSAELELAAARTEFDTLLYEATIEDLMQVIRSTSDAFGCVMIIGHNPSVSGIVGYLTPVFAEHVPTSGIAIVQFDTETWKMVQPKAGKVIWFENPKNIPL